MHAFIPTFILMIIIALFFSGCDDSTALLTQEQQSNLAKRSATVVSMHSALLQTFNKLNTLNGADQTEPCNGGGEVRYSFAPQRFPAGVEFRNCVNNTIGSDGTQRISTHNGTVNFTGSEANATATISGDFQQRMQVGDTVIENLVDANASIHLERLTYPVYDNLHTKITSSLCFHAQTHTACTENAIFTITETPEGYNIILGPGIFRLDGTSAVEFGSITYNPAFTEFRAYLHSHKLNKQGEFIGGSLFFIGANYYIFYISALNTFSNYLDQSTLDITPFLWR